MRANEILRVAASFYRGQSTGKYDQCGGLLCVGISRLRPHSMANLSRMIGVKVAPEVEEALRRVAVANHESMSAVIRRVLANELRFEHREVAATSLPWR